jgi:hypothetical protein
MTLISSFLSASQGVSPQELSRAFEQGLSHAKAVGETALQAAATSEDQRVLLREAFVQEMERTKKSLASLLEDAS